MGVALLVAASTQAQNLFVATGNTGAIFQITPQGMKNLFSIYGGGMLAFDSRGNLFSAFGTSNVYELTPSGVPSIFATGLTNAYALAFDGSGNLFVAEYSFNGRIVKITPGGVQSTFATGLKDVLGLAFNSAGNLFVPDELGGNIDEYTTNGDQSTFISGLHQPTALAFDGVGNLAVSTGFGVYEFKLDGTTNFFAVNGAPQGLAFNSAGDLFVATYGSQTQDAINESTPDGVQSTFISLAYQQPRNIAFQPIPELATAVSNGAVQLTVTMPPPNKSTIVQASADLVNWTGVYTNTPPFTFTDPMDTTITSRFYRAVLQQ
jgi:sugar lactone lactonase YvrE